jgi:glycosyltransferase involved in cell wall biosynthesis
MHVAFWSPAWPLDKFQNGIITYVQWMKIELEKRGHRVSVFTETVDDADSSENVIRVTRSPLERLAIRIRRGSREFSVFDYPTSISRAILREHRRHPIDVIEMEESFGWFATVQRLTSIPVIVKLHGPAFMSLVGKERETPLAKVKMEREGVALRAAGIIVSPSKSTLRKTIERYGLAPQEARVVPNPLSAEGVPVWSLNGCDRRTILFVGRFDLIKGADILLEAFLLLVEDRPDLKLIFVGPERGIPASDGHLMPFAEFCDSLFPNAWRKNIEFRGPLGIREVAKLRTQAMLTVVPSRSESSGYTLLEAMLQGCPTVSTDAGALPESIVHEVTGRLARSDDPVDLANQIRAILDEPELAEELGRAARLYVLKTHSPTAVVDAALAAYESLLAQSRFKCR